MRIIQVFNNNVLLARDDAGKDVVALGRGLGFQAHTGDEVDPARISRRFVPQDEDTSRVAALMAELPYEHIRLGVQISQLAATTLGLDRPDALVLPLADHIDFAVRRSREHIASDHPLRWEVTNLFPRELELGKRCVELIDKELDTRLGPEEAVSLALHFVNAQFTGDDLARTVVMTETISQIFDVIGRAAGQLIDEESMSATRFVTHLRYLFIRVERHTQIDHTSPELIAAIGAADPTATVITGPLAYLIEARSNATLTVDERAYLTLHVSRLLSELPAPGAAPARRPTTGKAARRGDAR